ncbi:MAG: hypothetical protein B7Z54_06355 [Sphingobacteriales bacterium 12-47-4]|nr:MAG: hypothetical protein B7Z54_06355 [Sphingobacteriales bacterium 12-47-4]
MTGNKFQISRMRFLKAALISLTVWYSVGCEKPPPTETDPDIPDTNTGPRLSYGDTLFFPSNTTNNFLIDPVSKPAAPGYFKSIPEGLMMDTTNGSINISQSESGLRYKVYYVAMNGVRLDSVKLVLSGIDYQDSIYEIAQSPILYDTAFPVYNARPEVQLPCPDDDDDNGNGTDDDWGCVFDETDLNNDGNDDIPGVIQEKLLVDPKKGFIDVEASFRAGLFGSDPGNGLYKDLTIYYRLLDGSNKALNRITVRIYHFRTRADIPQELLEEIQTRRGLTNQINSRGRPGGFTAGANGRDFFFEDRPKRPPMIIIVSQ